MRFSPIIVWSVFLLFILSMIFIDLRVFHRKVHRMKFREAVLLATFWVSLALLFNLGIYFFFSPQKALEFLTGYIVEFSLSMDNLFVFLVIFTYFSVPAEYQHRVLYYGILGALAFRLTFIVLGVTFLHFFHWLIYVMGAILIFSGYKLFTEKGKQVEPEKNPLFRWAKKIFPITPEYRQEFFFVRDSNGLFATPLFLVLIVVESTDIVFAIDSIPAILAITRDTFIVFSSNAFAILGLRTFYFLLASLMPLFRFLHYGLSLVLIYIGCKMLLSGVYPIPTGLSLLVVSTILLLSVVGSLLFPEKGALAGVAKQNPGRK
ncbi:MAG: TerC family protein [bacterium JZ-2024 1]